ncbi:MULTISPECIES: PP2C family serine/threonine-protein phosphatase [unclassified Microcella]|uniref:PP2C family protein-serine/threonine phosphatase n=1 Tax=unclassified Microcella TaxID=2630066 RepID=UPI001F250684|nr:MULTISPECIES: protein phosphatase 2C domain-containing protein [unclassified Microcella]
MRDETVVPVGSGRTRIAVSAQTSAGAVRPLNEDSFRAAAPLFVVADGMGGHERGDVASRTAIAALAERVPAEAVPTVDELIDAIAAANDAVRAQSQRDGVEGVSGTTLVVLALVRGGGDSAYWMAANVGDSRLYEWTGRELTQLTVDHSYVQELVDTGHLTAAEALVHPDRNVITRAVGVRPDVVADVWLLPVSGEQVFLLCSDGLTRELSDDAIAELLMRHGAAGEEGSVADALVEAAVAAGGSDNVTAIVVESSSATALVGAGARESIASTRERPGAELEDTLPRAGGGAA